MVCVDGFVPPMYEPVKTFDQADVDVFLPLYEPIHYLTPEKPMVFGSGTDDLNTMEFHYMHHQAVLRAGEKIEAVAREFETAFGHFRGGMIDT
jgi:pyruvate/2-oxoacid:ferredoxin oxidoreductase alpha subunit